MDEATPPLDPDEVEFEPEPMKEASRTTLADRIRRLLLDEDPELRGQRVWVMFAIAVILVATLNGYAMIRQPEVVDIADLHTLANEVVIVEGTLISWVEDPYNSGEHRMDLILESDSGVAEVRWYKFTTPPPIGSTLRATGDVVEYNGRLWIQALGTGAVTWGPEDVLEAPYIPLSRIAADPEAYVDQPVTVEGYLASVVPNGSSWHSTDLADHPHYRNTKHRLEMQVHSSAGVTIEAGSKVRVQGHLSYSTRTLQYALHVQGPEIFVDPSFTPTPAHLDWSTPAQWSYEVGEIVVLSGSPSNINGTWSIISSGGDRTCLLPSNDDLANDSFAEATVLAGRLVLDGDGRSYCLDRSDGTVPEQVLTTTTTTLSTIANDIAGVVASPDRTYTIDVVASNPLSPLSDLLDVTDGSTYMKARIPARTAWLEAGQPLRISGSVSWSATYANLLFEVEDWSMTGDPPAPEILSWASDPLDWSCYRGSMVRIDGNLSISEEGTFLTRDGSDQRLELNLAPGAIGTDALHRNQSLEWTGRLIQTSGSETLGSHCALDVADITDEDGDRLADSIERALGWSTASRDTDGDGLTDRDEFEAGAR